MNPTLRQILKRIKQRQSQERQAYLRLMERQRHRQAARPSLGCSNLAHTLATLSDEQKRAMIQQQPVRIGIVTAYNDILSAHQPFHRFPGVIKQALAADGVACQVAGGVPAMCDGVTQGREGMELSLFSRDTIAMSTAVALSHDVFDGVVALGTCDKIVPGLLMGLLRFGHLPAIFLPAGPMMSGLGHAAKQKAREQYARGQLSRQELIEVESKVYHGPGTCTFYGTANTNQLLLEVMGLHLPGSTFVGPADPLRDPLTALGARHLAQLAADAAASRPLYEILTEESLVNAVVALMASGGSTNHTLHLVAIARCAGIQLTWDDFDAISRLTPRLVEIYPNGNADVNQFRAAGGVPWLIQQLLNHDLLLPEARTIWGQTLADYAKEPYLDGAEVRWRPVSANVLDATVLRSVKQPFSPDGGLRVLRGRLGQAVVKVSALKPEHRRIEAPARIFRTQEQVQAAFQAGQLHQDVVVVLPWQGPAANGMPELHKLNSLLAVVQEEGFRVALLTDGRLSGASAKVLAAVHVSPEAARGGALAKLQDGDQVVIDADRGLLDVALSEQDWSQRQPTSQPQAESMGWGRELFQGMRSQVSAAEAGATVFKFSNVSE
jgi:phosphogluconate dehydratase